MNFGTVLVFAVVILFSPIFVCELSFHDFERAFVHVVNLYRRKHGSDDLEVSLELSAKAQENAQKQCDRAARQLFAVNNFSNLTCISKKPLDCIHDWYKEGKDYDYDHAHYVESAAHFTLLIWKNSRYIGIGQCLWPNGSYFTAAITYPPGNELQNFMDNIQNPNKSCLDLKNNWKLSIVAFLIINFLNLYLFFNE